MSNVPQLLQNAISHHQAGRLGDAEKAYGQILRLQPAQIDALRLLGALYLQMEQPAKAVEFLEKAIRLAPANAETLTNLGVAFYKTGRLSDAAVFYEKALALKPDYLTALNNLGALSYEKGQIAQALRAYEQILRINPDHAPTFFNYGNALLAQGKLSEAAARYEKALQLKPDYLEAMMNLGLVLGRMGEAHDNAGEAEQARQKLAAAQGWLEKALRIGPQNIVAMNNLGNVLRHRGKPEEAIAHFHQALRLRPDYTEAAINMSLSLRDLNRLEEAVESCRQAVLLQPTAANAHINLGVLLQDLRRHEEALTHFTEALRHNPASVDAKWNKALSLLALGQYREGWAFYESGLGVIHMRGDYFAPERRWNGEDIAGKRLLIWCEQGLGDNLQFVRYVEMAKARECRIIVVCPRSLRRLFRNCPFIDDLPESVEEKDFDLHVPIMSLAHIFGTHVETIPTPIPYLHVSAATRAQWAGRFADKSGFKVGLVWAGNPREKQSHAHLIDRRRSLSLERLRPLFAVEGARFYNLQMGAKAEQIDTCGLRDRFIDFMPEVRDFEDTAAMIENLDLVISVDTSVAHLAGGLGKPVWVLSRFDACWRWLQNRPDSPWYPTARVFGQKEDRDWDGVVEAVRDALATHV